MDYATGGVIPPGSWITLGEKGPELYVPSQTVNVLSIRSYVASGFTPESVISVQLEPPRNDDPDDGSAGVLAKV